MAGVMRRAWDAVVRVAATPVTKSTLSPVADNRGGWFRIHEPFGGAWQRNIEWSTESVLAHHAVYTCVTLIASDIGKLRPRLVEMDADGIWSEAMRESPYWGVLRKPNRFQNHIQFKEAWVTSRLTRGNTYALKVRDGRGMVRELYLLDPTRVAVLVAETGEVFYRLQSDNLSGVDEGITVPASEIIHDRMNCLFHPLVGVSPIFASGMAAAVGLRIEKNAGHFFENGSTPGGTLTTPHPITAQVAEELAARWTQQFGGENAGRVAVLGDDLKWSPMRMTAVDAQMIEHLKWSAETVASTFHVPAYKIGVGAVPSVPNAELLDQRYYSDCLQSHIEAYELCMDEGLGIGEGTRTEGRTLGVDLDLDGLLRMDSATQMDTVVKGVRGGVLTPNNGRKRLNEQPILGGDTVYLQHQDYPIEALYDRTLQETVPVAQPPAAQPPDDDDDEVARMFDLRARTYRLKAKRAVA
jgi:HK97 family phage portal protein